MTDAADKPTTQAAAPAGPKAPDQPRLPWQFSLLLKLAAIGYVVLILAYKFTPREDLVVTNPSTNSPLMFQRGHDIEKQFEVLWGLAGLRRLDPYWVIVLLATVCLLCLPRRSKAEQLLPASDAPRKEGKYAGLKPYVGFVVACAAGMAVFAGLSVSGEVNLSFGDGSPLPQNVEEGRVFPAEVLTCHLFQGIRAVLSLGGGTPSGHLVIAMTSVLCGGVFVGLAYLVARWVGRSVGQKLVLFLGLTTAGYMAMFFGYAETTQLETLAMMMLLAAVAAAVIDTGGKNVPLPVLLGILAGTVALTAHGAGILLAPACLFLIMGPWDGKARMLPGALLKGFSRDKVALLLILVALPVYLLVLYPFVFQGRLGNMAGGGDNSMFVPWHLDYAHRSEYQLYSLFSSLHLLDIFSAMLVACPFAIPLTLVGGTLAWRERASLSPGEKRLVLFCATAAGFCLIVPLFWNHDFGMWGDWNLAATYLAPLNFLGWVIYVVGARHRGGYLTTAMPLLVVQAALTLGLLLQLY